MRRMDLDNILNDSFLNIVYNNKFKSILEYSISNPKVVEKHNINYINILYAIDNVPPCFNSTRKNLKDKVDAYINFSEELDYYKNEKFYKTGFIDGYKFLLELQKQERNDKTNE